MRRLLEILLNIKPSSWVQGGQWRLEWLAMPQHDVALLLALVAAAVIWIISYLYRKEGSAAHPLLLYGLIALRLLILAGVLVMLMEPVLVFDKTEYVPSHLIILSDDSGSMDLTDAYIDTSFANQATKALNLHGDDDLPRMTRRQLGQRALDNGMADQLAADGDRLVHRHDFAARLFSAASTQPSVSSADRSATAIGASIRQAIAAYPGQPIAGILLLTDGQNNAGEAPSQAAEFAAAQGIPIVCLALGTPQGPRTARITKIDVSPVVFVRDPNPIHVLIESRGMAHLPATVVLERSRDGGPWEEIGRQPIVLEETGQLQTATFQFQEDRPAKLQMRARLEDAGAPLQPNDHTAVADVRAIREKMKVLFIAGQTFPEVEFIRNMLLRDAGISASTWLQSADADYEQPGNPRLKRLPETSDELNDFDCIILYDPDPAIWPTDYSQMLSDFVAKAGGGLIYIAGERNTKDLYDRPDDPALSWLNILPVSVEPGLYHTDATVKLSTQYPWKLEVTPEGKNDPIFTFADRPEENETILSNLPGMYWYFPVTRAKPGATVLARHADPRMQNEYGQHVLLATQLVGPGRTFFVGFDSTYRWRYLDDRFFDSFWAHMIERAGRSKQLGGRYPYTLASDRDSYRPGSQVTLTATFDNPADQDAGLDALHGEVGVGDDPLVPLILTPRAGDPHTFQATFPADKAGLHFVRVWTGDQDIKNISRAATLEIPVELPNLEYDNPTVDLATLRAVARAGGGQVFDLTGVAQIPAVFKTRRIGRTLEDRQEIWDAPILFGSIVCAIILEWILRKRARLV